MMLVFPILHGPGVRSASVPRSAANLLNYRKPSRFVDQATSPVGRDADILGIMGYTMRYRQASLRPNLKTRNALSRMIFLNEVSEKLSSLTSRTARSGSTTGQSVPNMNLS